MVVSREPRLPRGHGCLEVDGARPVRIKGIEHGIDVRAAGLDTEHAQRLVELGPVDLTAEVRIPPLEERDDPHHVHRHPLTQRALHVAGLDPTERAILRNVLRRVARDGRLRDKLAVRVSRELELDQVLLDRLGVCGGSVAARWR